MGIGTGLPLFVAFGFLVLGRKRMQAMLGQLARLKVQFDKASRGIKSQLASELGGKPRAARKDPHFGSCCPDSQLGDLLSLTGIGAHSNSMLL